MNEDNGNVKEVNVKAKKYAIALSFCTLVVAVFALIATNIDTQPEQAEQTTVGETMNVEVKVTNEPDTRIYETIIVPATEITTEKTVPVAETVSETSAQRSKPVSYSLPLGTDIGDDYSQGVPVYSDVMGDWRTHDGVDFNGAYGDGVKAIADGFVKEVYFDDFMGGTVVVDHGGGVVATYCGVEATEDIKRGIFIEKCDKLGTLSEIPSEANAQFPHLHLEIRVDGEVCDPLEVMGFFE